MIEDKSIVSKWNDKIFNPIFERSQSVAELYKDFNDSRKKAINYLNKIYTHSLEKDQIASSVTEALQKLEGLADKISTIRKKYTGNNEDKIMVINQLELFIVNAYNKLVDDFPYNTDQSVSGLFIALKNPQQGQEPILKPIMYYNHQKNRIKHTLSSRFLI